MRTVWLVWGSLRYGFAMTAALRTVTEEEFLALPETMDRVELVDGEVIVSPSPSFWHQDRVRRLVVALSGWADQVRDTHTVCVAPLDVRFGDGCILQPDAFVLKGSVPPDHEGPLDRTPVLCIEVLSSNRSYDRITKRFIYAGAGVAEYWIVSAAGLIERWSGPGLERMDEVRERLVGTVLPGFEYDVTSLFEP